MRGDDASDEESAYETVALSLTYGDETETPIADVDAAEHYGWKIAAPEAYPTVMRKERGMEMRPPTADELALMEACLRALPDFIERHPRDDLRPESVRVRAGSGERTLTLTWIPPEIGL
jgi:hypothetical protein